MSEIRCRFVVDVSPIASFEKNIDSLLENIVDKAAFDILGLAQEKIPVDTGAAKNSGYVRTSKENTLETAIDSARAARAQGGRWHPPGSTVEFVFDSTELKSLQALVGFAVNYALPLEINHTAFLIPSVLEYEPTFKEACRLAVISGFKR